MTSWSRLADGVRRKFSQLTGGKQINAERKYLMACKRKKKMDVERACRQICLGVSGRGTLPSTASAPWHLGGLGPETAKPGCTKPAGAW